MLEDREGVDATRSRDDAPIKRRSMDEGEAATKRISDDSEEMATVLTSMDAGTILGSGVVDVPTGSGSIPTASNPAEEKVPTGSDMVPTASLVFAIVVTPYRRRKGKEVMVESETPKKQKVQEQIDAQVARELEEKLEREDQRKAEQIARDTEIARIHAEEELQSMINGLDRNNETIAKYLQKYYQFASELPMERRIELINELMEDFIPMGLKEESERIKRKGLSLEQESAKDQKTSEEVPEEAMSSKEVPKEKDRANIAKSSTLPYDSAPRVTSLAADEGSMQLKLDKLTSLCTILQRQHSKMVAKFKAQELEINRLKARVKLLEDREGVKKKVQEQIDAQVARELEEQMAREDQRMTEQVARDAEIAIIHAEVELQIMIDGLDRKIEAKFTTVWKQLEDFIPIGSKEEAEMFKRKGIRIKMLEDKHGGVAEPSGEDATIKGRSLETGEEEGVDKSIERGSNDTEELVNVLTSLDATSILTSRVQVVSVPPTVEVSTVSVPTGSGMVPTEYEQFAADLDIEERIELINDLVKYQDNYAKIEDFVPMGSKEEGDRVKRKWLKLEQESAKKVKTSEEVSEEVLKTMMQLVPVEE
nr:hypothetical protein [Tanacetum cinerariifolium]